MLSKLLWIAVGYAEPVVVHHCEYCWASGCDALWAMLRQRLWISVGYADPGVLESWYVILSEWLWILVCNTEPVCGNHGVLCWASGSELWCAMLSQWLWIIVNYAESVVIKYCELYWDAGYESLCVMLNRVCGNHGMLCWASGCELLCAMLSQWL
jgi:hypothetical protein